MNIPAAKNNTQPPRRRHWARRSHRVLGIASLLFVFLISLSGLILNHADGLGLSRHAAGPMLLKIYGVDVPPIDSAFSAGEVMFATSSGILFANGKELAGNSTDLCGAVEFNDMLVIATSNEFLLTTRDGELIERFEPELHGAINKLGTDGQRIVAMVNDEPFVFDAAEMNLSTTLSSTALQDSANDLVWSQSITLGEEQAKRIGIAGLTQSLNWERVLLDLHSGRILPKVGRYIADLTALSLLYLCMSGIVLWTRRRRS
jgi:hypothetical protein